jgi:protease II
MAPVDADFSASRLSLLDRGLCLPSPTFAAAVSWAAVV